MMWLAVAVGAAVGAPCRYLLDTWLTSRFGRWLPWGTVTVNLIGSAFLGMLAGTALVRPVNAAVSALLGVGFCGAFTTASTLAWETVALAEDGWPARAVANIALSLVAGLGLSAAGFALALAW
ncbi:MAG: fluoride efflux transporter CrcB [Actinomycetota bacterium]|nr:fluoride efflux transporter CrcB [Actinomycetota bacterium]